MSILSEEKVVKEKKKEHLNEYLEMNDNGEVSLATLWDGGKQ